MCRLLEQLSDHNRGQPPRSADDPATAWRDTCTASLCERAATERRLRFSTQKFSSPGHKGNHETPDTRRARSTSSPSVPPDAFLRRIWQDRHPSQGETRGQGPLGAFTRAQKASFFAHGELTKGAHSEGLQTLS